MTRTIRKLVAISIGLVPLSIAAPALADEPCPPLDLTCVVDGVVDEGGQLVDDVTDPIGDTTDPVVRPILDRVHDVLNGGDPTDPPGGHGTSGGGGSGAERPGTGVVGWPPHGEGATDHGGGSVPTPHVRMLHHVRTTRTSVEVRPTVDPLPSDRHGDSLGRAAAAVAQSLLAVGVLFGISLGFLVIQQRLDRKDPKLVEAPLQPEIVTFA
jgi:hypothetical protein